MEKTVTLEDYKNMTDQMIVNQLIERGELQREVARLNIELADYRAELKHANKKIDELEAKAITERNGWASDLKAVNDMFKEQTKRLKDREAELESIYDDYRKTTELLSAHKRLEAPAEPSYVDVNQLKRKLLDAIEEIF